MKLGGTGGGRTITGLHFEGRTDIVSLLSTIPGYKTLVSATTKVTSISFNGRVVAEAFKKHAFYSLLDERGIDWRKRISKRLLPDDALLVDRKRLFVIEVKYQQVAGSVDEKLQTCHFKKRQYERLLAGTDIEVNYVYILNDWFRKPEYKDVLDYIQSVGCHFHFETVPLSWLGLPQP